MDFEDVKYCYEVGCNEAYGDYDDPGADVEKWFRPYAELMAFCALGDPEPKDVRFDIDTGTLYFGKMEAKINVEYWGVSE